ncbi:hypothetical protein [Thermogemmatispora sp.]|uniref:hypothetical protein n=1 Tax=Thermogemmatispora sp. TaxID=1968838 RepID=UPI001D55BFA1|nr:hypothetical protein [Thermogemmatispora sp.]MBX5450035.1 hypothetical protein [Thermogemmatispora sp.]
MRDGLPHFLSPFRCQGRPPGVMRLARLAVPHTWVAFFSEHGEEGATYGKEPDPLLYGSDEG